MLLICVVVQQAVQWKEKQGREWLEEVKSRVHHVKDVLSPIGKTECLSEEETSLHHNTQLRDLAETLCWHPKRELTLTFNRSLLRTQHVQI